MPRIVRWYLRTALIMFVLALAAGVLQALGTAGLTPVYFHLLMVGWVTQFIMGVAIWMLPKYTQTQPRGSDRISWAGYGLLNLGLLLRAAVEPLNALNPGQVWGWGLVFSALLQWLAGLLFVVNAWRRVKEK
jgi:peptidoglycan biosynthesis protein MviN/MurJ (putative lipid II flippase)